MSSKISIPQLVAMLAENSGRSKKQVEGFVKAFFSTIAESLAEHDAVKIKAIGTFKTSRVEARKSVNVSTGAELKIPPHFKVTFTPSKTLAESVNREFSWLDIMEVGEEPLAAPVNYPLEEEEPEVEEGFEIPENDFPEETEEYVPAWIQPEVQTPKREQASMPSRQPSSRPAWRQAPVEAPVQSPAQSPVQSPAQAPSQTPNPVPQRGPAVVAPVNGRIENTRNWSRPVAKENEGERLGEELEKEFGDIQPVEPFGPIDPDDPEPGQPVTEDVYPSHSVPFTASPPPDVYYITREEFENMASKKEFKILQRNFKKLKIHVEENQEFNRRRRRRMLIWSVIIAIGIMVGGFFTLYTILNREIIARHSHDHDKEQPAQGEQKKGTSSSAQLLEAEGNTELIAEVKKKDSGEDINGAASTTQGVKNKEEEKIEVPKQEPARKETAEKTVTDKVTDTRFLTTIAREHYGNLYFWPYIYMANAEKLGNPDKIQPGTEVVVPELASYGVDPLNKKDIQKAKKLGVKVYQENNR